MLSRWSPLILWILLWLYFLYLIFTTWGCKMSMRLETGVQILCQEWFSILVVRCRSVLEESRLGSLGINRESAQIRMALHGLILLQKFLQLLSFSLFPTSLFYWFFDFFHLRLQRERVILVRMIFAVVSWFLVSKFLQVLIFVLINYLIDIL